MSGDEFPLERFFWTISRTIGERVDAPAFVSGSCVSVTGSKRLPIVDRGRRVQASIVRIGFQLKACEAVSVRSLTHATRTPATVDVVALPKRNGCVCDWRAAQCVCEKRERLCR